MATMDPRKQYLQSLGAKFRQRREYLGFSQRELASRLHVDRTYVSKLESGKKDIGVWELNRLCKSLDMRFSAIDDCPCKDQKT